MTGPPTSGKSTIASMLSKRQGFARGDWRKGQLNKIPDQIPDQWRSFADLVKDIYQGTRHEKMFEKTLRSLVVAWEYQNDRAFIVSDEALINCGFSLAIRMPDNPEYTEQYFNQVPLPDLLVMLTAEDRILQKRNQARGERDRWEKTQRSIDAHHKFLPLLYGRGCRILEFNTGKEGPLTVTEAILSEVEKLG